MGAYTRYTKAYEYIYMAVCYKEECRGSTLVFQCFVSVVSPACWDPCLWLNCAFVLSFLYACAFHVLLLYSTAIVFIYLVLFECSCSTAQLLYLDALVLFKCSCSTALLSPQNQVRALAWQWAFLKYIVSVQLREKLTGLKRGLTASPDDKEEA